MAHIIERSATDVRQNFAQTLNDSEYRKPQLFKRNRCSFGILTTQDLLKLTSTAVVDVALKEHEDMFIATSETIPDLVSYGENAESAISAFCQDLREYAEDYYASYELYSASPNRTNHIPYVFRALLAESAEDIRQMLEIENA